MNYAMAILGSYLSVFVTWSNENKRRNTLKRVFTYPQVFSGLFRRRSGPGVRRRGVGRLASKQLVISCLWATKYRD